MTATIELPTLTELFAAWEKAKLIADAKAADAKNANAHVDQVRTLIHQRLTESGTTSTTDAATGYNARIETRREWKVTDADALAQWAETSEFARAELYTFDQRAALNYCRAIADPIPGIEQVTTERFVVTPPKGAK